MNFIVQRIVLKAVQETESVTRRPFADVFMDGKDRIATKRVQQDAMVLDARKSATAAKLLAVIVAMAVVCVRGDGPVRSVTRSVQLGSLGKTASTAACVRMMESVTLFLAPVAVSRDSLVS